MKSHRQASILGSLSLWMGGTASRMFLVLSLALLPLAIVALISTLSTMRIAQQQKVRLLATAVEQSASKLESDILAVQTAGHLAVQSLSLKLAVGDICGRMQVFVRGGAEDRDIHFMALERSGKILCPPPIPGAIPQPAALAGRKGNDVMLAPELGGLLVRVASTDERVIGLTLYRETSLRRMIRGSQEEGRRSYSLYQGARRLEIGGDLPQFGQEELLSASAPVGKTGLVLGMAVAEREERAAQTLSLLAPLAMWFAAAFLGWLVVRWVLIQPLVALRQAISEYQPGRVLVSPRKLLNASWEIAELAATFEKMSAQVTAHEEEMRQALERQTSLTREVHHRVKNNLQIISSLINLHARAATDANSARAYASIQRRVDALAVVQRNHYAEMDDNRGVSAQPLITEIAANLKSSVLPVPEQFDIQVDCDPVSLHQDVAAPVAFLIAELADLAISSGKMPQLRVALIADTESRGKATLVVSSDLFRSETMAGNGGAYFLDRVLTGLSRQLRAVLEYDGAIGEYRIRLTVL
jgi:two-component system, sensor histidine kinase PdtaS